MEDETAMEENKKETEQSLLGTVRAICISRVRGVEKEISLNRTENCSFVYSSSRFRVSTFRRRLRSFSAKPCGS